MTGPAGKPKATDSETGLPDQRDAAAPPAAGDEDEAARLRAEVAALQAQLAAQPGQRAAGPARDRARAAGGRGWPAS